jgi:hypothetical protein
MAVSTIDGTLEEAVVKRSFARVISYERLRFRLVDGGERVVRKIVAERGLAERLQPGARGRFYLFKVIDHKGVCGLRDASGGAWFAFIKGAENGMLTCAAVGGAALLLSLLLRTWLTSWAVICLLIGVPMYILYSSARREAERRFAADEGRAFR